MAIAGSWRGEWTPAQKMFNTSGYEFDLKSSFSYISHLKIPIFLQFIKLPIIKTY